MSAESCLTGQCLIVAKTLKKEFPKGKLIDVVEPEDDKDWLFYPGKVHHVVLKVGDEYWDGMGVWEEQQLLDFWRNRAFKFERRVINFRLEPHNRMRAKDLGLRGA
jgi:hypothetical protein